MLCVSALSAGFLLAPAPPRAAQRMGAVSMSAGDALGRRTTLGLGLAAGAATASTMAAPAANAEGGNTVTFQIALAVGASGAQETDVKGVLRRAICLDQRLTQSSTAPRRCRH